MPRYNDEDYTQGGNQRQRDLILSSNEYAFVRSQTNGAIKTYTGPVMVTISQQESLVLFNQKTKRFEDTNDFDKARQLFTSAPEGWYVVLKNPSNDNAHPEAGKAVNSPELQIGRKINIAGPCSFSLYPGQMTKVVQGHRLRSNQYLLARVYDAAAAEANRASATIVNSAGEQTSKVSEGSAKPYFAGQLLVIKGTEVSFYMPPTGIEVLSIGTKDGKGGNDYIRDAVTLERLEYAILKDENGNKRYMHGPAVVFPEPTETFVETPSGGTIFRALELSPISGIYVKVIAEYDEEFDEKTEQAFGEDQVTHKVIHHPIGEELFITGNDQMIYYPRPEHAMIQYDGKYMHHAIAIPEGEGRYILNRLTGEITTIKGPKMYLPDPRTEVVVKRKLTEKECKLMYPENDDVLEYNLSVSEKAAEKAARRGVTNSTDVLNNVYATSNQEATLAIFEANANISRGVSYTKPRTIVLDTKYDGVVAINVWTGYAINVVSKTGKREVVVGPTTRLLDYDETLESMSLSTGRPKTTDNLLETAYLRVENNKISDLINVQTKDFVDVQIKVSYCVDFLEEYKDKWFSVDNYVKYMCDRQRSLLKREAKQHYIEDFYDNVTDIVRKVVLDRETEKEPGVKDGRFFPENGMLVHDVEVLSIAIDRDVARILEDHQEEMIKKTLELSDAAKRMEVVTKLAEYQKKEEDLNNASRLYALNLSHEFEVQKLEKQSELEKKRRAEEEAKKQAEADMQVIIDAIQDSQLERSKKADAAKIATEKELAEIEKARQTAYAETVANIMKSVSPDLVAAMNSRSNVDIMESLGNAVSPYAIAKGESIGETINTLLRGTSLQETIKNIKAFDTQD